MFVFAAYPDPYKYLNSPPPPPRYIKSGHTQSIDPVGVF